MVAPAVRTKSQEAASPPAHPSVHHVNLAIDVVLSNMEVQDLRAVVRSLLARGDPGTIGTFSSLVRSHITRTQPSPRSSSPPLFARSASGDIVPTSQFYRLRSQARVSFGAGMGKASFIPLLQIIRAISGLQWDEDSDLAMALAEVDCDIAAAVMTTRDEVRDGRMKDHEGVRSAVAELRAALTDVAVEVESWGGDNPFERGLGEAEDGAL